VTVSDGELIDFAEFMLVRRMNTLTDQGFFNPPLVSVTSVSPTQLPISLHARSGQSVTGTQSYEIVDPIGLSEQSAKYNAEMPVDQDSGQGMFTLSEINQRFHGEWTDAGSSYDGLAEDSLLKAMIDNPLSIVNSIPPDVPVGHEFLSSVPTFNVSVLSHPGQSNSIASVQDLNLGEYARIAVISDPESRLTVKYAGTGTQTNFQICPSIVPEIHQWNEAYGVYEQSGNARQVGDIYGSARDVYALLCQLSVSGYGNHALINSSDWLQNIESKFNQEQISLTQVPATVSPLYRY